MKSHKLNLFRKFVGEDKIPKFLQVTKFSLVSLCFMYFSNVVIVQ